MPASENQTPLPILPGYSLRWRDEVLLIRPDCWRGYRGDREVEREQARAIVPAVVGLAPRAIIIDLDEIPFLPAFLVGLVIQLGRQVGFVQNRRRLFLVRVTANFHEYLRISHLDRIIDVCAMEEDALRRWVEGPSEDDPPRIEG